MAKESKVNLDILRKLVKELEAVLAVADTIKAEKADMKGYIVEMSKAAGLAAGIMAESGALVGDIQHEVWSSQSPSSKSKDDPLASLLGALKGGGLSGKN